MVGAVAPGDLRGFADDDAAGGGGRNTVFTGTPYLQTAGDAEAYEGFLDHREVRKAATELRAIWVLGNEYLQSAAPWSTFKTDTERAAMQVRLGLNLIRLYAVLSSPFIPFASEAMLAAMRTDDRAWPDEVAAALEALPAGHAFDVPEVLFAKISDESRDDWQERFKGNRD